MAEPKKNTLKNTLKEPKDEAKPSETKPKKEKDKEKTKPESDTPATGFRGKISSVFAFLSNPQFQRIFGLTLLLFAVYLAIAFTSFAFTWQQDQSKVLGNLFSPQVTVDNWLGKFGALLSHIFIHKWFGAASYIFAFLSFLTGFRIFFNLELLNLRKAYQYSFFFLIFSSITLGYFFHDDLFFLGGAFGYTISNLLNACLGTVGTGVLLGFSFLVFHK